MSLRFGIGGLARPVACAHRAAARRVAVRRPISVEMTVYVDFLKLIGWNGTQIFQNV